MTTPYGVSTSIGSGTYSGYNNAPITGPLSTNQYPNSMAYHNYGTLTGQRPTPPQFYPSQEPIYAEMNTNARAQYIRASSVSSYEKALQDALGKLSQPTTKIAYSSQRHYPVSTHVNYIAPIPSSMRLNIIKSEAIGKSAFKVGLPLTAPISTKSYYPSGTYTTLRRARSGGCTAPKKKGSIYNHSLAAPGISAWGSLPRQNY